ncbi:MULTISPECIES: NAD(P)H-dependent oxidoreductase [Pseudonocardia]|uniref:General stress protein 14 n=2 Tax=Pseudonocardia TaxID=1847 RepID=A0A1Y2N0T2_PSEAH|nr:MULTISPECIES: NAD(P)H-dependent oxidoreductase [Pseudonocardia]OSY40779.1 General stress protein 14 [Pseudonocardia autotrophica]TDN71914.1 NAD(P)H dehydrogenase (quinone) [Pseudonocardia autotrophica]BBG02602.1 NAD(P)H dehydrogenase [Pseudonocardia autotrophica]GEC24661.1 NAD(P)H dehydrogenase [Pseudonocardia saturnea]
MSTEEAEQQRTLVVVAHPDPGSLTRSVARAVAGSLEGAGAAVEVADLAGERFDPAFTIEDVRHYHGAAPAPADVVAEQQRIDRADRVVLVFPVYWWSMPALLKGWIDRVYVNGWAFDHSVDAGITPRLTGTSVHLVAIAGGDADGYRRHGYTEALRVQIESGIFGFCGATVGPVNMIFESEATTAATFAAEVESLAGVVSGPAVAAV